ncbi:hypothetical protein D1871_01360 [Nakamurella silvestris]|nr:hypothetical protein D1871_01360 [Nakamurella silvestris]
MTEPGNGAPRFAPAPEIALPEQVATGSGIAVQVPVVIRHQSPVPARLTITVVGLDGLWVPAPLTVGPVEAGQISQVVLELLPERGALAANYPFVVVVEATPIGTETKTEMGVAESTLIVDNPDRVTITVDPLQPVAVFSKKIRAHVSNPGRTDREVSVTSEAARGAAIHLGADNIVVPAGRTVTLKGRITVTRPRFVGHFNAHTFTVTARGLGAPEYVEGSLKSRPLLRNWVTTAVAAVLTIALWVGLGVFAIPKISNYLAGKDDNQISTTQTTAPTGDGAGAGATTGAGTGDGSGTGNGDGSGDGSAGGDGGTGDGGTPADGGTDGNAADGVRLAGTITGTKPAGITVSVEPTTVVEASDDGAAPAQGLVGADVLTALRSDSPIGKTPESAVRFATTDPADQQRSTESTKDGSWSFAGVKTPGFLLVSFSAAGYQTQRFIVDSALLADAEPMKIEMLPGNGSMSGAVTGPGGAVKGATITLTDGTSTVQTSSVSTVTQGADGSVPPGSWQVNGLSTPGTYLVTVAAVGYGTSSSLVKLDAGGKAVSDIDLTPGVGAFVGLVSGSDDQGVVGGIGGITVTATDGDKITRTATTVTSGPVGRFTLPDLPTPGDYTLTASGPGFQNQVRQVSIGKGVGSTTVDISMSRTDGVVDGVVSDETGKGLTGAGLTLTGGENVYKTMTVSDKPGSYRFGGVPPGTYVLSATQYGRRTTFATVEIEAAKTVSVNLTLKAALGDELTADGILRGRVVDARTNGPLTCDRAPEANVDCQITVSTYAPVAPAESGKPSGLELVSGTYGPGGDFTLPMEGDEKFHGLLPGTYTISITAPGFEAATTQVEVTQGRLTAVAPVTLQPLAMLAGTVTTRVGATATPSCVVLVKSTDAVPGACTLNTKGTACTATSPDQTTCRVTGADGSYEIRGLTAGGYKVVVLPTDPEYIATKPLEVQLDLGESARSDAVLDRWGRAEISVLRPNLNTLALTSAKGVPVTLTRDSGTGVEQVKGTTNSQGQITLTGLGGEYTVTAAPPDETAADGRTGLIAVNQTATLDVVVVAQLGPISGRIVTSIDGRILPVVDAAVTVSGVVKFNGRTPVSGTATVVTNNEGCYAIVPADWGTKPVPAAPDCPTATITPVPGESNPVGVLVTGPDAVPENELSSLVTRPVSLTVVERNLERTNPYQAANQLVATSSDGRLYIPTVALGTQPRPFGNQKLFGLVPKADGSPSDEGSIEDAVITVTRRAAGSGAVSVTVKPSTVADADNIIRGGDLTWQDSTLTEVNKVIPGRYSLQVSKVGYQNGTVDVWCDIGASCIMIDPATQIAPGGTPPSTQARFEMSQLPRITGKITAGGSTETPEPLSNATITTVEAPAGVGIITVKVKKPATGDPETGEVVFLDQNLSGANAGLARPGNYVFTVALKGYETRTVGIQCLNSFNAPGGAGFTSGCQPLTVDLVKLPKAVGSIDLSRAGVGGATKADVKVAVTATPFPGMNIRVVIGNGTTDEDGNGQVDALGSLVWVDSAVLPGQIQPGTYGLSYSVDGYVTQTVTFTCLSAKTYCGPTVSADGTTDGPAVTLLSLPQPQGTVNIATQTTPVVDWSKAVITISQRPAGTSALTVTATASTTDPLTAEFVWRDPNLAVAGTVRAGTYVLTVALPGFKVSDRYRLTCVNGELCLVRKLVTESDPSTDVPTDPIVLQPFRKFSGKIVATPVTSGLDLTSTSFQVVNLTAGIGPITLTAENAAGTDLKWQETGLPTQFVTEGRYRITVSRSGFTGETVELVCTATTCSILRAPSTTPQPVEFSLTAASTLQVSVQAPSETTPGAFVPVNGAQISLSGTQLAKNTVTAAPSTDSVSFPDLSTAATVKDGYVVAVRAGGFKSISVRSENGTDPGSDVTGVQCTYGSVPIDASTPTGIVVFPGETTRCVITLDRSGVFAGTAYALVPTVSGGTTGVRTVLSSVQLTISHDGSPTESFSGVSDSSGNFRITGTNLIEGLNDGSWTATATISGYKSVTGPVLIDNKKPKQASSPSPFLTVDAAGNVTVLLSVEPVTLKINLYSDAQPVTEGLAVTLTTASQPKTCKLKPQQDNPVPAYCILPVSLADSTPQNPQDDAIYITDLNPGIYTLRVAPYTNRYQGVTTQIQITAGSVLQATTLSIDTRSSTVTGKVVLDNTPSTTIADAKVWLTESTNTNAPAKDLDDEDLEFTTAADGVFTFTNVPDGIYRVVVSKSGFSRYISGEVTIQSALNPTPAAIVIGLGASQRQVNVVLSTTLGFTFNLAGTKVQLTRNDLAPGETATPLVSTVASRPQGWTASFNNVPIGEYDATIIEMPGHLFTVGDYTSTVSVPAAEDGVATGDVPVISTNLDINESALTITANWVPNTCFTTNASNGPSAVQAVITPANGDPAYTTQQMVVAGSQATSKVYVPAGRDYDFTVTPAEDFFAGGSGSASIGADTTTVSPSAIALLPTKVPVKGISTIDGSGAAGLTITGVNGANTVTGSNTNAAGTTSLCLEPGREWTLSISRTSTTLPQVQLPSQTITPTAEPSAANERTFAGRVVIPTAGVELVAGRNLAVATTVTVYSDPAGAVVASRNITVAAGGTTANGRGWVLPVAAYQMGVVQTDASVVYSPDTVSVAGDGTAVPTMTYNRVVALFKVKDALGANVSGAAVLVRIPSDAVAATTMGNTNAQGEVKVFDLVPGTWGVNASKAGYNTEPDSVQTVAASATAQTIPFTLTITPPPDPTTTSPTAPATSGGTAPGTTASSEEPTTAPSPPVTTPTAPATT